MLKVYIKHWKFFVTIILGCFLIMLLCYFIYLGLSYLVSLDREYGESKMSDIKTLEVEEVVKTNEYTEVKGDGETIIFLPKIRYQRISPHPASPRRGVREPVLNINVGDIIEYQTRTDKEDPSYNRLLKVRSAKGEVKVDSESEVNGEDSGE